LNNKNIESGEKHNAQPTTTLTILPLCEKEKQPQKL